VTQVDSFWDKGQAISFREYIRIKFRLEDLSLAWCEETAETNTAANWETVQPTKTMFLFTPSQRTTKNTAHTSFRPKHPNSSSRYELPLMNAYLD